MAPMTLAGLLGSQRVLPLVEVDDRAQAIGLARLLVDHGSPVMEIALRTPGAISAIEAVRSSVEGAVVGAGTVVSPDQLADVAAAGAVFAVSPGSSASLLSAAAGCSIPFVPGVATATEVMRVAETGMREVKFFPAEAAGGVPAVSAMAAVMPSMRFLPTGGIDEAQPRRTWRSIMSSRSAGAGCVRRRSSARGRGTRSRSAVRKASTLTRLDPS